MHVASESNTPELLAAGAVEARATERPSGEVRRLAAVVDSCDEVGGPQGSAQADLESRDGDDVGPAGAVEDVRDGGVIDAGHARDLPQAGVPDGGAQRHGEATGNLAGDVLDGDVRPALTQVAGTSSLGRHASSVSDTTTPEAGDRRARLTVVAPLGGENPGQPGIDTPSIRRASAARYVRPGDSDDPADIRAAIDAYHPAESTLSDANWWRVATVVREAVRARAPRTVAGAREFMGTTAAYVDWCHRVKDVTLSHDLLFEPALITEYANLDHEGRKSTTVGNHASRLQAITESVNPEALQPRPKPRQPSDGRTPYSEAEVRSLWKSVNKHKSPALRRELTILLAGGLGAGLTGREVCDLRVGDITADDTGVTLRVSGPRERDVHVRPEYEHIFAEAAQAPNADAYVFLPRRKTTAKNTASNFLSSNGRTAAAFDTQRTRGTWVTGLLAEGTDIRAVMQAMGVTDFSAIARYLKHVPALTDAEYRAQVRGEQQAA
ncbi:tyrosine-type recombinase/integrase [Demequina soli]|uniref:tyrosine-type recombinase/integrase n=1 Tax=Demequina soli TaxID=1638987 RepID=UPI000AF47354|nr:site-specific integrase [Demequina soli]